jgi:hypothetical protein
MPPNGRINVGKRDIQAKVEEMAGTSHHKIWREQTIFQTRFVDGSKSLTFTLVRRFLGDSPNATGIATLEFVGECETADGEIVNRVKRYDISGEIGTNLIQHLEDLSRFERERLRK